MPLPAWPQEKGYLREGLRKEGKVMIRTPPFIVKPLQGIGAETKVVVAEFLKKTYTIKDVAYMCNLQMKIASLQQGDKSIKEYVGEMEQLWDELALFEPEWYDPRDIGVREK
ncbi:hypothetical protein EJ110_NYTH33401 [Nymphaea thermarum]|nr:hypothetical protein EJ110_NYTH33401 [Nymphaea thermarum]